jgi:hypothetical protein
MERGLGARQGCAPSSLPAEAALGLTPVHCGYIRTTWSCCRLIVDLPRYYTAARNR